MGKMNKRTTGASYVSGPDSSGIANVGDAPLLGERGHGMNGIIGRERAKSYKVSSYADGDNGGSAGGYGASYGVLASSMHGITPGGVGLREGGVRAGGVSCHETLPFQPQLKKKGYDEHGIASYQPVHGVDGIEGMPSGEPTEESSPEPESSESNGFACPHGCGAKMKSAHGLARHIASKHGGFAGLGHALTHGSSFKEGEELRGETEDPVLMKGISEEYARAAREASKNQSSYVTGDSGKAYSSTKR